MISILFVSFFVKYWNLLNPFLIILFCTILSVVTCQIQHAWGDSTVQRVLCCCGFNSMSSTGTNTSTKRQVSPPIGRFSLTCSHIVQRRPRSWCQLTQLECKCKLLWATGLTVHLMLQFSLSQLRTYSISLWLDSTVSQPFSLMRHCAIITRTLTMGCY